jgi:hypothetical protein
MTQKINIEKHSEVKNLRTENEWFGSQSSN